MIPLSNPLRISEVKSLSGNLKEKAAVIEGIINDNRRIMNELI